MYQFDEIDKTRCLYCRWWKRPCKECYDWKKISEGVND